MGVFPADSKKAIPKAYHDLMTKPDSTVLDFYPQEFKIDLNGKPKEWQGVALLPFIDESRLLAAMAARDHLLSEEERQLNEPGNDLIIISADSAAFDSFCGVYQNKGGEVIVILLTTNRD
jgi:5'-3' exoribonuclease 2